MALRVATLLALATLACRHPATAPTTEALDLRIPALPGRGLPGLPLRGRVSVEVLDSASQRPLPRRRITWVVTEGGGTLFDVDSITDSTGRASAAWRLGRLPGLNRLAIRTDTPTTERIVTIEGAAFQTDQVMGSWGGIGCGLRQARLWCWGEDFWAATSGVSDLGFFGWVPLSAPAVADSLHGFVSFAVSASSVCGLDSTHVAWCASTSTPTFAPVAGLPPLRQVTAAASNLFHCGLALVDSTAWCWQMGRTATRVPGSPPFTVVRMEWVEGNLTACGLLADSTALCWGPGPLGDGTLNESATPVPVHGGLHFAELAIGTRFACGRTADQTVWCWGADFDAAGVRNGTVLTPILARTGVYHLAIERDRVLALTAGSVLAWRGAGFEHMAPPQGLPPMPVLTSGFNTAGCLVFADHEIYCVDEQWDNSTVFRTDTYSGVQPISATLGAQPGAP